MSVETLTRTIPTLSTPRLILRPRTMADLDACFRMDNEPGTLEYIDWPAEGGSWHDKIAHRAFIRARIRGPYPAGMGYWVVTPSDRQRLFLGWMLLIPSDVHGDDIEIGWRFTGAARGRGFATEAATAVLLYARQQLGLDRVVADIHPGNTPSRRVAEKIGMTQCGPTPGAPHVIRYCWPTPSKPQDPAG